MKVLVISDNNEEIEFVDSFMKNKGYDVIVYQWLIKAIDNIEEIKPDIVIVSSAEYPRRWKTLASFLQSGIGGNGVKLYLYEPEPLSSEEEEKAKALGIEAFIPALDENTMEKYFPGNQKPVEFGTKNTLNSQIIITNPNNGSLLSGKIINFSENNFECKISSDDLENGQLIKYISICYDDKVSFLSADVTENNKEKGILSLSVCEYYEEI